MELAGIREGKFSQAFNTKNLKKLGSFRLPGWDFVDQEFDRGKTFKFSFNDQASKAEIDRALEAAAKEQPSVADMNIEWKPDQFHDLRIEISKGNYAGLTYVFKALDDLYDKYGAGMGWG